MNLEKHHKKIGDVCEVIAGQSPKSIFYNESGQGVPFYQGKKEFGEREIGPPKIWTKKITKEAQKNDILMSVRAPVGPVNICNQTICIGRGLAAIRPSTEILRDFLFYFLLKHESEIVSNSGAVFNSINKSQIEEILLPVPTIYIQQQIVEILDKSFAAIDQAKANIEKNAENAKELFQSKLNEIFSQKGDEWEEKKLGEVCNLIGGGTPSKSNQSYYGGDIPWATVRDMNVDVISSTDLYITKEGLENSSTNIVSAGNVVIATRVGLGKVCLVENDTAINQDLKGVIPKKNVKVEYLYWWFKSVAGDIKNAGTGATVQGVKLPFVKSLKFPLTSIENQNNALSKLSKLNIYVNDLQESYMVKLNSLNELKKSILHKAFEGELTKDDIAA